MITTYYVKGMHCASCETLVLRKIKKVKKVEDASFSGKKIIIHSKNKISFQELQNTLQGTDYSLSHKMQIPYKDIMWGIGIVAAVYVLLKLFSLDQYVSVETITVPTALMMGILASFSSCMATSGGLLLGLCAKLPKEKVGAYQSMFHSGRILSYTIGGLLLGLLGSIITINSTFTGVISFIVSIFMVVIGLQLIGFLPPLSTFGLKSTTIEKLQSKSSLSAFLIGGATFLLPCGFTQSLQLYALSSANGYDSMMIMLAFALGTLPALIFVGSFTHMFKTAWRMRLTNIAAVIVLIIGVSMIVPSLTLMGFSTPTISTTTEVIEQSFVPIEDGYQIVNMDVVRLDYEPHIFTLQKDIPVKWIIDASEAVGCAKIITAPKLDIASRLSGSTNIIEFTPTQTGEIPFHCSMAMTTPGAKFIVK